jgi:hypothetical protein
VLTACSIATQCGIFTAGGVIIEGPVFRLLDDSQMLEIVPRFQVLAHSSLKTRFWSKNFMHCVKLLVSRETVQMTDLLSRQRNMCRVLHGHCGH